MKFYIAVEGDTEKADQFKGMNMLQVSAYVHSVLGEGDVEGMELIGVTDSPTVPISVVEEVLEWAFSHHGLKDDLVKEGIKRVKQKAGIE